MISPLCQLNIQSVEMHKTLSEMGFTGRYSIQHTYIQHKTLGFWFIIFLLISLFFSEFTGMNCELTAVSLMDLALQCDTVLKLSFFN